MTSANSNTLQVICTLTHPSGGYASTTRLLAMNCKAPAHVTSRAWAVTVNEPSGVVTVHVLIPASGSTFLRLARFVIAIPSLPLNTTIFASLHSPGKETH